MDISFIHFNKLKGQFHFFQMEHIWYVVLDFVAQNLQKFELRREKTPTMTVITKPRGG